MRLKLCRNVFIVFLSILFKSCIRLFLLTLGEVRLKKVRYDFTVALRWSRSKIIVPGASFVNVRPKTTTVDDIDESETGLSVTQARQLRTKRGKGTFEKEKFLTFKFSTMNIWLWYNQLVLSRHKVGWRCHCLRVYCKEFSLLSLQNFQTVAVNFSKVAKKFMTDGHDWFCNTSNAKREQFLFESVFAPNT